MPKVRKLGDKKRIESKPILSPYKPPGRSAHRAGRPLPPEPHGGLPERQIKPIPSQGKANKKGRGLTRPGKCLD